MPGLESRYSFLWLGPSFERKMIRRVTTYPDQNFKKVNSKVVADGASKRMILQKIRFRSGTNLRNRN
jgi:hypothetical protein